MENNNNTQQNNSEQGHNSEHAKHEEVPEKVQDKDNEVVKLPRDNSRIIKIVLIAAGVLVIGGLLFSFKSLFIAAIVNGTPISRFSVISELERQGGKDALDNLIDKHLITSEAKAKNITVTDDEVNEEIKKFEEQFSAGGQNLDDALKAENLTREDLKQQVKIRKQIEKLIGDKANVSDEELQKYLDETKAVLPAGQEEATKTQFREQMRQQKLAEQSVELLKELREKAKISTYVEYKGGTVQE